MPKSTGRFWVPDWLIDDSLQPLGSELKTFLVIARFANKDGICWPSVSSIAECVGMNEKTIRKHLRLLLKHELIAIVEGRTGGRGRPTKYRLKPRGEGKAA